MVRRMPHRRSIADHLVAELQAGRIHSVAFVVPSDARWTSPLYDLANMTARRGWQLGPTVHLARLNGRRSIGRWPT
jgi:hypothetical protein